MAGRRLTSDERREQILATSRKLFSERHYGAVSMDEIARASGVARGLVNHYFSTKRDLYLEVVRDMFRGGSPPVPEYVNGQTPEDRLAVSVDRWLDMVWENREAWLAGVGAEGLGRDPDVEAILDRVRDRAVDNILEVLGVDRERRASPVVRTALRSYGGLAEAAAREWLMYEHMTRQAMHTFLTRSLVVLMEQVLPDVEDAMTDNTRLVER